MDPSTLEHGQAGSTFPGHRDEAALDLGTLSATVGQQVLDRLLSRDFSVWADALSRVGNCARPVRLRGTSDRIDRATGEVLSSFSSADHPLGVVHMRCGNRRGAECPSCSRLYAADMFHLIRAGVAGGKTVPRDCRGAPAGLRDPHCPVVRNRAHERPLPSRPPRPPLLAWPASVVRRHPCGGH